MYSNPLFLQYLPTIELKERVGDALHKDVPMPNQVAPQAALQYNVLAEPATTQASR